MSFKEDNLIPIKTFEFALRIIKLYTECKSQNEFILSKQILRSGTSIGANVEEAIAASLKKILYQNFLFQKRSQGNKILAEALSLFKSC